VRAARWLAAASALAGAVAARGAAGPELVLPLDCEPGRSCWIVNYVDLDAGKGARDYRCGGLTYDGHKGTDFAIRDLAAIQTGRAVLAAADGVVATTRDGMADASVREAGTDAVEDRECGNGVRIDHGDGLVTQYCHLRKGSVSVRRGERVRAAQPIGQVGLSGLTEFPHVHVAVFRDGKVVDPFTGRGSDMGCGDALGPLWDPAVQESLPYARRQIYNVGLAGEAPIADRARTGSYSQSPPGVDAPVLALWFEAFGMAAGDRVRLLLQDPAGKTVLDSTSTVERDAIRVFRWGGKRRHCAPWPAGSYRLSVQVAPADGSAASQATATAEVRDPR
jgi:hypothetical protein